MTEAPTALITGASSGIGAAFARRLAAAGHNLILVARRLDRLEALAEELASRHNIVAEVLPADLAQPAGIERVETRLSGTDTPDLLINNAGFGTTGYFADIDLAKQLDMIQLHIVAPVRLCRAVLPGMIARSRGAIINVASIAAYWPLPENANYAASKMYLIVFSQSLQAELEGTGVRVQALCPGFTYTEFHDTAEFARFDRRNIPAPLWMSADELARLSLAALERGEVVFPRLGEPPHGVAGFPHPTCPRAEKDHQKAHDAQIASAVLEFQAEE